MLGSSRPRIICHCRSFDTLRVGPDEQYSRTEMDVQERKWTRLEYERLVEAEILGPEDRVELLGGAMICKEPQYSPHATAILLVERALTAAFGPGWVVRPLSAGDTAPRRRSVPRRACRRWRSRTRASASPTCCPDHSSGTGSASTRPELSRARSFCSAWTRRMSGINGRTARKTIEISQKSSA